MTEIELAWLAGILEGEGCFRYSHSPSIILAMTDMDVVERSRVIMDAKRIWNRPLPSGKTEYRTMVHGPKAFNLMIKLLPIMGNRRREKIKFILTTAIERKGLAYGERAGPAKLTDEQAREIKRTYVPQARGTEASSSTLAKKFGVSQAAIWYVVNKRREAA